MSKSTALSTAPVAAAIVNWNDKETQLQIREAYGKNLNEGEWKLFMGLGVATGLNPFLREIWAVKYGTNPASVFVGRDGYRRSAQAHPEYEYHYAMAVYANDVFSIKGGVVEHDFKPVDRGALVGAYCVVKRKSSGKEAITWVPLSEYKQTHGVWATKPATMIVKVAEAQGLRASFQELFAGTYEESENWKEDAIPANTAPAVDPKDPLAPRADQTNIVDAVEQKKAPARRGRPAKAASAPQPSAPVIDAEVVDEAPAPSATPVKDMFNQTAAKPAAPAPNKVPEDDIPPAKIRTDQTKKLFAVWGEYKKVAKLTDEASNTQRKALMREMFFVDSSVSLNEHQADELIARIEGMTELARDYSQGEDAARAGGESF